MHKHLTLAFCSLLTIIGCSGAPARTDGAPVYEALGGQGGLQKIVDDFVKLALADSRIADTFKDVDLVRLRRTLAEQFCELAGGPCKYSGKSMQEIHQDLKISNAQFNAITEDLQIVLEQHDVPSAMSNKLVARLAPMQKDIVTR
jgi:hemoglobin